MKEHKKCYSMRVKTGITILWREQFVKNYVRTGFSGNGCEQVLNSHLNAKASQSCRRPATEAIFFWIVVTMS